MTDYYCRYCDEFIREEDADTRYSSILHGEVDTRREEVYQYRACPRCGHELFERADNCFCGEMKLETEKLCRDCRKVAKEEFETAVQSVRELTNTDQYDAQDILINYIEFYL